jgi:hypothetical protein
MPVTPRLLGSQREFLWRWIMKRKSIRVCIVVVFCLALTSTRQLQTVAAKQPSSPAIDSTKPDALPDDLLPNGYLYHGFCASAYSNHGYRLTGSCVARGVGTQYCIGASEPGQCPVGRLVKRKSYGYCLQSHGLIVDSLSPCVFTKR